ncbi:hypothetical protein [Pediococcus pentosaceus]|uniref:hypothetical protein n=1 Tax=Pediococcus pentosaceus TaxID=1255 RepID=UPI003982BCE4
MTVEQDYLAKHFFNPLEEEIPMGVDLLKHKLVKGDEVYKFNGDYLLADSLDRSQLRIVKAMKLEKVVL